MSFLKWVYHTTSLWPMSEMTSFCNNVFCLFIVFAVWQDSTWFRGIFWEKGTPKVFLPRSNLASLCCKQPETGPTFLVKEGHKLSNIGGVRKAECAIPARRPYNGWKFMFAFWLLADLVHANFQRWTKPAADYSNFLSSCRVACP